MLYESKQELIAFIAANPGLTELRIDNSSALDSLPELPESLTFLRVNNCPRIKKIERFPSGIQNLMIDSVPELTRLPSLPTSLKELRVFGCHRLTDLPELPESLQLMIVGYCNGLTALPELRNVIELVVKDCPALKQLPRVVPSLQYARVTNCPQLVEPVSDTNTKDIKMLLTDCQQSTVLSAVSAHTLLMTAVTDMFSWFQTAVAGYKAEADFDEKCNQLSAGLEREGPLPVRLANEWAAYTKSLRDAYGNFGRDVVHRHGVDEPAQVRNLALNIAASAFKRIRENSREVLINQIEGTTSS